LTTALLNELQALGIRLFLDGNRLGYRAPRGTMTPELLARLSAQKVALMDFLSAWEERSAVMEFDAKIPRKDAERLALADMTNGIHRGESHEQ
jgi:hypothetical protein